MLKSALPSTSESRRVGISLLLSRSGCGGETKRRLTWAKPKKEKEMKYSKKMDRLVMSQSDILEAQIYANELKRRGLNWENRRKDRVIFQALVEALTVAYARPFTGNNDRDGKRKEGRLSDEYVPKDEEYRGLHERLTDDRDTAHAHSDIAARSLSYTTNGVLPPIPMVHEPLGTWTKDWIDKVCDLTQIVGDKIREGIDKEKEAL